MTKYEFNFLLNEEVQLEKIRELIKSLSGGIIKEEKLGKKNLAYPIKKNLSADFYSWLLEINEEKIKEFKKKLNFNFSEKIIRYLLLKISLKKP